MPKTAIRHGLDTLGEQARGLIADAAREIAAADVVIQQAERRRGERRKMDRHPEFRCPICDAIARTLVIEIRHNYAENYTWRRHRCCACDETYTSTQRPDAVDRPRKHQQIASSDSGV